MIEQDPHESNELQHLREENARLKVLLTNHGIPWEEAHTTDIQSAPAEPTPATQFTTAEKIALFRRLFRGRADVYPQRWDSAKGPSGYAPACGNEWRPGIRIYDYVENEHPQLDRMWKKRQRGYRAMGYLTKSPDKGP